MRAVIERTQYAARSVSVPSSPRLRVLDGQSSGHGLAPIVFAKQALISIGAAFLLGLGASSSAAIAPVLPIAFHVAETKGHPVVDPSFIEQRVARANEIFAPYEIAFAQSAMLPLGAEHAAIESRADRDALSANVGRGVIDCFVVRSLRDVDDPIQMRRGVHWHSATHVGTHFLILSSIAGPNVLAHELGHFLGNPKHSQVPGNLMSYLPKDGLPFLDSAQARRLTRTVRDYLRRHELEAIPPAQDR